MPAELTGTAGLAGTTLLFCPADRSDRFARAAAAADLVILDLEDGVAPPARPAARAALVAALPDLDPARTVVRVSPAGTPDFAADLAALDGTGVRLVMLAKAESAAQVAQLAGFAVLALCETARGVLAAPELAAAANVVGLMWGAEDLVAGLGGRSSRFDDGRYRDVARYARAAVLLAAGAHGRQAIGAVYLDIADLDGEARDAAASGFGLKACIHPTQVPVVRTAFAPSADEVAWARRVLAAAREAGVGVFAFEGRMVDAPILRHAELLLRAAQSAPAAGR